MRSYPVRLLLVFFAIHVYGSITAGQRRVKQHMSVVHLNQTHHHLKYSLSPAVVAIGDTITKTKAEFASIGNNSALIPLTA